MSLTHPPVAILTDVFGTIVDWRTTITFKLIVYSHQPCPTAPASTIAAAIAADWSAFAQAWRESYYAFIRSYDTPDNPTPPFKTVDDHHRTSLDILLHERALADLWTDRQKDEIALIWHYLDPWPDSAPGLKLLSKKFMTATLSNGNRLLLTSLARHGGLTYSRHFSAEDFKAYKPSAKVYEGAAEGLGLETRECALVAAHLGDLEAARRCGMQTIYIERRVEERWGREEVEQARREGWVDMWVSGVRGCGETKKGGGLMEVARRFGLESENQSEEKR